MGRYVGPACRLCAGEGMKLFLKGNRGNTAKCAVNKGVPLRGCTASAPGGKSPDYGMQLRESSGCAVSTDCRRGSLRWCLGARSGSAGLTAKRCCRHSKCAWTTCVPAGDSLRLDGRPGSLVTHGHFTVNGAEATIPSMTLKEGAKIEVKNREDQPGRRQGAGWRPVKGVPCLRGYPWTKIIFRGDVLRIPSPEEIAPFCEKQLRR